MPLARGVCLQPLTGSHDSAVHGLLSSQDTGVPEQLALVPQTSLVVQTFRSSQATPAPSAWWVQAPVLGLQSSLVHASPSSHEVPVPPQTPAWQWSFWVQGFSSVHDVPSATLEWRHPA